MCNICKVCRLLHKNGAWHIVHFFYCCVPFGTSEYYGWMTIMCVFTALHCCASAKYLIIQWNR